MLHDERDESPSAARDGDAPIPRCSQGTIVVADRHASRVRVVLADGTHAGLGLAIAKRVCETLAEVGDGKFTATVHFGDER